MQLDVHPEEGCHTSIIQRISLYFKVFGHIDNPSANLSTIAFINSSKATWYFEVQLLVKEGLIA